VVVKDRTNAIHVRMPEPIDVVVIDVGWTRQDKILPVVATILARGGSVLTLVKPHYESEEAKVQRGVLTAEQSDRVLWEVVDRIKSSGWELKGIVKSPIEGQKGNVEFVAWLQRTL
jgi:23S rRNA (cytidine1920-2'-O)/16S rRNA (cytidine1409-2'-O)-methyltransferase